MHIGSFAPRSYPKGSEDHKAQAAVQPAAAWNLRHGWVMILAFLLQVYAVYGLGAQAPELARKVLVVGSYLMLGFAVWSNRPVRGILLLGLGLGLNFLAIASNGGLMPVAPDTMVLAGKAGQLDSLGIGQWVPSSKDVLLPLDRTALWPLTDVLVYRSAFGGSRIYSIGDVLVVLGLFLTCADLIRTKTGSAKGGQAPRTCH